MWSRKVLGTGLSLPILVSVLGPLPAMAQGAPVVARPVVQALPSADSQRLSAALARLARSPRDAAALQDAADAAKALGDYDAAIGFYRRADEITPNNARVKAGLAGALAMNGDPVSAIPLFAEAERAGAPPSQIAVDRGLAYDLVGANVTAQHYYTMALTASSGNEEARMRLALSQAIAGDSAAAQATLMPLLQKQDKPGWRARAFALAIAGDTQQAIEVSNSILPSQLAQNIAPYLRYMPRLTRAQQAAAANLGKFPRASEIGRDDARVSAYATQLAASEAAAAPRPAPQAAGAKPAARGGRKPVTAAPVASSAPTPAPARADAARVAAATAGTVRTEPPRTAPAARDVGGELPPVKGAKVAAGGPVATTAPSTVTTPAAGAQGFDLARVSDSAAGASPARTATPEVPPSVPVRQAAAEPAPVPSAPPRPQPAPAQSAPAKITAAEAPPEAGGHQLSLAEIFADLGKPTMQTAPAAGAVDIRQIEPARPAPPPPPKVEAKADPRSEGKADDKPEMVVNGKRAAKPAAKPVAKAAVPAKPKKPVPPPQPSRIWVQIGVGRNKDAIAFDWRRYLKQAPALFKGHQPYVSEMGRTNRVLIGPFATQKAANAFLASAKKQGFDDALPWTSDEGQVVDVLPVK
ncbi:SPOR domain-containing protein [Sphingomonas sp. IC081]|uniref:SPOR domain-containing protein n=1 Tax=Sphingomonas sp. IC081 TaxID=304378 RepID=UPI00115B3345|nr:SPOR domain-containing protein [Sphingomonas sp. IC081]QDK31844.1 sporulation protein SsgA [Sphingomonas sp. IC081]